VVALCFLVFVLTLLEDVVSGFFLLIKGRAPR
jgi:hypothetical protein